MKQTPIEQKITEIIHPAAQDMGFRIVQVLITSEGKDTILRVLAENRETRNIGLDECAKLSREISVLLDVEDPIDGAYRLEVSSPGIDRPLVNSGDFEEFTGYEAKLEIMPPLDGQKRFRGVLLGIDNDHVKVDTDQGEFLLPLQDIQKAKLVLTENLINHMQKKFQSAQ